uniref:Uncharacterized protein n=1 Tax=Arundo donax TaxID=35708 RepID=A0A0A9H1Y9_ARUDO
MIHSQDKSIEFAEFSLWALCKLNQLECEPEIFSAFAIIWFDMFLSEVRPAFIRHLCYLMPPHVYLVSSVIFTYFLGH